MATKLRLKGGRLLLAAASLVVVSTMQGTLHAQSPALSITLAGQSMIRFGYSCARAIRCAESLRRC